MSAAGDGTPAVLLVVAASSGCGKTTLIERMIPALARLGVRAAAVKLTHHEVDPDVPGKDSHRLRTAGAAAVVLASPGLTTAFVPRADGDGAGHDLDALVRLAAAAQAVDVVLVEGGRDEPDRPRIEVVPSGADVYTADPACLVALVSTTASLEGVPTFAPDDVDGLAAHVTDGLPRA